jgi:hypothetical protein
MVNINDPSSVGLFSDTDQDTTVEVEPCERCLLKGRCPRCGSGIDPESNEPCDFCGFEDGKTEGKPYPHECFCSQLEDEL